MKFFAIEVNSESIKCCGINKIIDKMSVKNNKFSNYTLKIYNDRNSLRISFPLLSFEEGINFTSDLRDISNKFKLNFKHVIIS